MKTGEWTPCSASCGGGERRRRPTIVQEPTGYGAKCPDLLEEVENCNVHLCPIDCELEAAAESQFSASCGVGTRTRASVIEHEAKHGGKPCPPPPDLIAGVECRSAACPSPIHCTIEWSAYSPCAPCGPGTKARTATIVRHPQHGGSPCPDPSELTETATCFERPCQEVLDCEVRRSYWGECSRSCGGGIQTRAIEILRRAENGGLPCPMRDHETRSCNNDPCSHDCILHVVVLAQGLVISGLIAIVSSHRLRRWLCRLCRHLASILCVYQSAETQTESCGCKNCCKLATVAEEVLGGDIMLAFAIAQLTVAGTDYFDHYEHRMLDQQLKHFEKAMEKYLRRVDRPTGWSEREEKLRRIVPMFDYLKDSLDLYR